MRRLMTGTAIPLLLSLGSAPALGAAEWTFSDVDTDGNLELTDLEFEQVSRDTFEVWDADRDRRISEDELYSGLFLAWNGVEDDTLSAAEFREGFTSWFGAQEAPSFEEIDSDGNNALTKDELASGLSDAGIFAAWTPSDREGIPWADFHVSLFEVFDENDDEALTETEYAQFDAARPAPATTGSIGGNALEAQRVITLPDWRVDDLYEDGASVEYWLDEMEVYGRDGEEIGSIENVVFSPEGRVLSIIAEVGGFWDMFDTHVNVPWDEVEFSANGMTIPVNEENVEDYGLFKEAYVTGSTAESDVRVVDDDLRAGPRAFRATELIGDYARIRDGESFGNYGYVNDLIVRDGQLEAVVVNADVGSGASGPYAYPYYGYRYGFTPGDPYYNLPYDRQETADAEQVDYTRFGYE